MLEDDVSCHLIEMCFWTSSNYLSMNNLIIDYNFMNNNHCIGTSMRYLLLLMIISYIIFS